MASPKDADRPVPFIYRLLMFYFEPACALNGAYLLLSDPSQFLDAVSPRNPLVAASTATAAAGHNATAAAAMAHAAASSSSEGAASVAAAVSSWPAIRILTDHLAIFHICFVFNLVVVLGMRTRDHGLWRLLCGGMLLSDALHIAASVREFGGPAASCALDTWRMHDWLNFGLLGFMAAVRICVVLGLGMGGGSKSSDKSGSQPATTTAKTTA